MARRFLKSNRSIVFSPLESLEAKAASICCVPNSSDNLSSLFPRIATPLHDLGQRQPSDLRTSRDKSVRYRPDTRSSLILVPQRHLAWSPRDPRCFYLSPGRSTIRGPRLPSRRPCQIGKGFTDRRLYQVLPQ